MIDMVLDIIVDVVNTDSVHVRWLDDCLHLTDTSTGWCKKAGQYWPLSVNIVVAIFLLVNLPDAVHFVSLLLLFYLYSVQNIQIFVCSFYSVHFCTVCCLVKFSIATFLYEIWI